MMMVMRELLLELLRLLMLMLVPLLALLSVLLLAILLQTKACGHEMFSAEHTTSQLSRGLGWSHEEMRKSNSQS
jgi:hypothetical protein